MLQALAATPRRLLVVDPCDECEKLLILGIRAARDSCRSGKTKLATRVLDKLE